VRVQASFARKHALEKGVLTISRYISVVARISSNLGSTLYCVQLVRSAPR
jgi:hypothetical protein